MIQEIITFMIIGAAVALAISKLIGKIKGKKRAQKKSDFKKESFKMVHNCSDCSAECMLRNEPKLKITKNKELCHEIELRQKL
ncbi:MAG TPA: hypothetical protein VK872_03000 [Draconibacterium sp.]|jgi:hypothetical protein|nr:hypothetical protein [Draconibacterium sp.]